MGCVTKTLGRLLFVTIIFSSAYLHLTNQDKYVGEFAKNYNHLVEFAGKHVPQLSLPQATGINWGVWVKTFGLFEALTALLIIFGDSLGGTFLFLTLVVSGVFDYCCICNFVQWETGKQLQFARYLFFVGASLTLICSGSCSKKCCKTGKCKLASCKKQKCSQSCKPDCWKTCCKDGKCSQSCQKQCCKTGKCKQSCKGGKCGSSKKQCC